MKILIIGAGLSAASLAYFLRHNNSIVVSTMGEPVGGLCSDRFISGQLVSNYGPHIFHTNSSQLWKFINEFADWTTYCNQPLLNTGDRFIHLPITMNTFYEVWGVMTESEVRKYVAKLNRLEGATAREKIISKKLFDLVFRGYTEKQWGKDCRELSPDIITRLPVRLTFDNNYFDDIYQGIPIGGYSKWINNILNGIQVMTDTDFLTAREFWKSKAEIIIYTGSIDEFFGYEFGCLEYRSLYWKHILYEHPNRQGVAVINYTSKNIPYTRSIEHKHFEFGNQPVTILSEEYPQHWQIGEERFYPVNNPNNDKLYSKYTDLASGKMPYVIFGGRLGTYSYFDMDDTIAEAISTADRICHKLINR